MKNPLQGQEKEASAAQEDQALANMGINKASAREILGKSLPVPEPLLVKHLTAFSQAANAARQKKAQVRLLSVSLTTEVENCMK